MMKKSRLCLCKPTVYDFTRKLIISPWFCKPLRPTDSWLLFFYNNYVYMTIIVYYQCVFYYLCNLCLQH